MPADGGAELHDHHRNVSGGGARAAVFGVSDGLVSNVSLILGFAGAGAAQGIVRLAGLAGLVSGAFSMASGEYVSVKAHVELLEHELDIERAELERRPDLEQRELARIYEQRGVDPDVAHDVAGQLMRDPEMALEAHAREELGVDPSALGSPWQAALSSFFAFALGALVPLLPWFVSRGNGAMLASVVLGVLAAVSVGGLLAFFTERPWPRIVIRQVGIAALAATVTFAVGKAIGYGVG
jgi:VIT1/CCC1 family predicted Fe2+/Mn2+ transporter